MYILSRTEDHNKSKEKYISYMTDKIKERFKLGFVQMIDYMIETFPGDITYVAIRVYIKDQVDINDIIGYYTENIFPHSKMIEDKKDDFFSIPSNVPTDYLAIIKQKWTSEDMKPEIKERIWKYFDFFNKCIQKLNEHSK